MADKPPHASWPTTPDRLRQRQAPGKAEKGVAKGEELEDKVYELMELTAARAEAGLAAYESWGLTAAERDELIAKGEDEVVSHFEALKLDPELAQFRRENLAEYDARITELSRDPNVLAAYKKKVSGIRENFTKAIAYERTLAEIHAVENAEAKLRKLFERVGRAPGPIERRKLDELSKRRADLVAKRDGFAVTKEVQLMLYKRLNRRYQHELLRYGYIETDSRTALIRDILPDLLEGAPVLFQGETGSGKSELAKYICKRYLGKEPLLIAVSEQIKESQLRGSKGLRGGETFFDYSEFVKAMKDGRPVIFDEINLMPHEFAGSLNDFLQLRVGSVWTHPVTGEAIPITAPIFGTANLKSERYRNRYDMDPATLRRFVGGAGAREIHYHDIGKKNAEGAFIAPETVEILTAVLSDRHRNIAWTEEEAPIKQEEFRSFVRACRRIQEDFTLSIQEGVEESRARTDRLPFRELVITLKDQIEIMKAWKAGGFKEKLQDVVLREFFHKAQISGRAAKDRENMVRVFIANGMFSDTPAEAFKVTGLSDATIRQWQGRT